MYPLIQFSSQVKVHFDTQNSIDAVPRRPHCSVFYVTTQLFNKGHCRFLEYGRRSGARKQRPERPKTGPEMDPPEHPQLRRQPELHHHNWFLGWCRFGPVPLPFSWKQGPVQQGHVSEWICPRAVGCPRAAHEDDP